MKKLTNIAFATSFLFLVFCFSVTAQTNVSGGIYANTTWTLANSPYIVVDTVVVFPGDTLTIEPGVTVKFKNNMLLDIRGGLTSLGTAADSITFTSDSLVPHPGIWQGISGNLTIDYCICKYASIAFEPYNSTIIQHSSFYFNQGCTGNAILNKQCYFYENGVCASGNIDSCTFINNQEGAGEGNANVTNCTFIGDSIGIGSYGYGVNIINCTFLNNQYAVYSDGSFDNVNLLQNSIFCNNVYGVWSAVNDIINCNFSQNHIACEGGGGKFAGNIFTENDTAIYGGADTLINNYIYHNHVGLIFSYTGRAFVSNSTYVCNNTLYNLIYATGGVNDTFPNICWCDTDSATIRSKIYDGYININLGLVNFSPYIHCDSSVLTTIPPINCQTTVIITDIEENVNHSISGTFEIYPNPAADNITLSLSKNISKAQFKIFNMLGELKYSSVISSQQTNIDISGFADGVYLVEVITENNILRQKFIKQQSSR